MASRESLNDMLKQLLGYPNVYYQPPSNVKMVYPAIVYDLNDVFRLHADNMTYLMKREYIITVIDKKPDNPVIEKILSLPLSGFSRSYKADNLYHTVLTLYF